MERSGAEDFNYLIESSRSSISDCALFDASRYEFFGEGGVNEVDLGDLDEEIGGRFGLEDELNEYQLFQKDEVVGGVGSLSDIDDLATTFAKLNKVVSGPRHPGVIGDRGSGSFSRESSSAAEWVREADYPDWVDHHMSDSECYDGNKRWSSQPHISSMYLPESQTIYRTSSYPEQQQPPPLPLPLPPLPPLQHYNSEPIFGLKSSFTSFPPPGSPHTSSDNSSRLLDIAGPQSTFSRLHLPDLADGLHYSANLPRLTSSTPSHHNRLQNQWSYNADHSLVLKNILLLQYQNRLLPSQLLSPHQQRGRHVPFQPKSKSSQKGKQSVRFARESESNLQHIRSKYMTAEEIESILKLQQAANHGGNDPYVDDYYHQARLARKSAETGLKYRFCPSQSSKSRGSTTTESQPHLHIDSLGKVCFSSVRRLHSLLELEPPSTNGNADHKSFEKPLEREPMFAARVIIEDGLSLLLDVVDIDRLLQFTQPQDGGNQLMQKRHILLEGLAASLQLADPLGKSGNSIGLSPEDDIVFLRVVSLSKGRKLISKFLQLLSPSSELSRIVSMAILRHLRFLFGGLPSELQAANTVNDLVKSACLCIRGMDLNSLSACLVAVVCSSEQPPLRAIGNPSGDGASVILKCVLESAGNLLTDPRNFGSPNPTFWKASFDAFFGLLTKYCSSKYESIVQSLIAQNIPNVEGIDEEAVTREMPVELLRASLPHTDDYQKKLLLNFAQRSMPVTGFNARGGGNGRVNPEFVRG